MADIAFDSSSAPSTLRVSIKQSKTDPFRQGIQLLIGKTGTKLCPVAAMLDFLQVRGTSEGFLFRFEDGSCLTRQRLVEAVWTALGAAGLDQSRYCGHSFRIGATTEAAKKGIEDSVIKTLGRWKSLAYLNYVKIPRFDLVHYSAVPRLIVCHGHPTLFLCFPVMLSWYGYVCLWMVCIISGPCPWCSSLTGTVVNLIHYVGGLIGEFGTWPVLGWSDWRKWLSYFCGLGGGAPDRAPSWVGVEECLHICSPNPAWKRGEGLITPPQALPSS